MAPSNRRAFQKVSQKFSRLLRTFRPGCWKTSMRTAPSPYRQIHKTRKKNRERGKNYMQMKAIIRSCVVSIVLLGAGIAFGAIPPLTVTVSGPGGKVAFKGATNTA